MRFWTSFKPSIPADFVWHCSVGKRYTYLIIARLGKESRFPTQSLSAPKRRVLFVRSWEAWMWDCWLLASLHWCLPGWRDRITLLFLPTWHLLTPLTTNEEPTGSLPLGEGGSLDSPLDPLLYHPCREGERYLVTTQWGASPGFPWRKMTSFLPGRDESPGSLF